MTHAQTSPFLAELQREMSEAAAQRSQRFPDLLWAERIVQRHIGGENVRPLPLKFARDALGPVRLQAVCEQARKQAQQTIDAARDKGRQ